MTDQKAMREAMKLAKTKGTNFVSMYNDGNIKSFVLDRPEAG